MDAETSEPSFDFESGKVEEHDANESKTQQLMIERTRGRCSYSAIVGRCVLITDNSAWGSASLGAKSAPEPRAAAGRASRHRGRQRPQQEHAVDGGRSTD